MTPDSEAKLREILSTVDLPPSTMTATGLLQQGERTRRRRRHWLVTGVAGVATLGLASAAGVANLAAHPADPAPELSPQVGAAATTHPTACTVQRLPLPAGATEGEVNSGSPNGRYVAGVVAGKKNPAKPVRWDGTRADPIPIKGTGEAQGVNDSGVVVGEGQTADRRHFAWAYVDGTVVELPIPEGYTGAEATAINSAGQVAGVLFAGEKAQAVVWRGTTATARAQVLDAPGGAMAFGISDSGVVVGGLHDGSSAYRWDAEGRGSELANLAGTVGGSAHGVRGGWAYGLLTKDGEPGPDDMPPPTSGVQLVDWNAAVVWDLRTGQVSAVDGGRVEAISATGHVAVNRPDRTAAIREVDGALRALPALAAKDTAYAQSLSDDGTRAAGSSGGVPVRWSCAPGS
jgi:probable HAF family extracellular repeat protein